MVSLAQKILMLSQRELLVDMIIQKLYPDNFQTICSLLKQHLLRKGNLNYLLYLTFTASTDNGCYLDLQNCWESGSVQI